jgi:hypothetical protein
MLTAALSPSPARQRTADGPWISPPGHRDEIAADRAADRALARPREPDASARDRSRSTPSSGRRGRPLDADTRAFFESRFRADFAGVRVHTDDAAARSAASVDARAYTVGRDIAFGAGEYQPGTEGGRRLIAHELAHTVQPNPGSRPVIRPKLKVNSAVQLDLKGFSASRSGDIYTGRAITQGQLSNEVFSALLTSPRTFEVAGATSAQADANLGKHATARLGVVDFASKKRYKFAAGAGFRMNPAFWDVSGGTFKPQAGVDPLAAIQDLNVHPDEYAIACLAATKLTMFGGAKSQIVQDNGVADSDWIPGDWGYIKNTKFPAAGGEAGLEGENIIYTGKGKYWGHFGPGLEYKTLQEWFTQVKGWGPPRGAGEARIEGSRRRPVAGLV